MKVLVIGDLIIDRYIYGTCDRISPEVPVPVVNFCNDEDILGGAGNVASNLMSLKIPVEFLSVLGLDSPSLIGEKLLKEKNIEYKFFYEINKKTSIKTRIIASHTQMIRLDEESTTNISENTEKGIFDYISNNINKYSLVVISDYNKGLLTETLTRNIIELCNERNIKTIIDPKIKSKKYSNAYILKCNKKEASLLTETNDDTTALESLKENFKIKIPIITLSENGIKALIGNEIIHSKSDVQEILDVTGAGDCVTAIIAYGLFHNKSIEECIRLSVKGASIAIQHRSNYVIKQEDIDDIIVFTNGCFDILHAGHIKLFREAKKLGTKLIVGLNSDDSIRRLKGQNRPINKLEYRLDVLNSIKYIDEVIVFEEDTPINIIQKLRPNILVKGSDYSVDQIIGREYVQEIKIIKLFDTLSTSNILNSLKS